MSSTTIYHVLKSSYSNNTPQRYVLLTISEDNWVPENKAFAYRNILVDSASRQKSGPEG